MIYMLSGLSLCLYVETIYHDNGPMMLPGSTARVLDLTDADVYP